MRRAEKNWVPFVVFTGVLFFTVAVIISTTLIWRPEPVERNESNAIAGHNHVIALRDFLWVNGTQENVSVKNATGDNLKGLKTSVAPKEKGMKIDTSVNQDEFENKFMARIQAMLKDLLKERESSKLTQATTEKPKMVEAGPSGKLSFDRILSLILGNKESQPSTVTTKK